MKEMMQEIFNWGSQDIDSLVSLYNSLDDIAKSKINEYLIAVEENECSLLDINNYFYAMLQAKEYSIKQKLKYYFKEYEEEIDNYEVDIYTNYYDSKFDDEAFRYAEPPKNQDKAQELLIQMEIITEEEVEDWEREHYREPEWEKNLED